MVLVRHSDDARGLVGFAGILFSMVVLHVLDMREMRRIEAGKDD